jgi:hypothetical protein
LHCHGQARITPRIRFSFWSRSVRASRAPGAPA